jgi:uncharacterized repeat protein (TIGR03803 family)
LGAAISPGLLPAWSLTLGADSALHGDTYFCGANGNGGLYRIRPNGGGFRLLHTFSAMDGSLSNADGANPEFGLVVLPDGSLAGGTDCGGNQCNGTLYRLRVDD